MKTLYETMIEENIQLKKMLFTYEKQDPKRKRKPSYDRRIEIKATAWGSFILNIDRVHNENEIWFSDENSFREFVAGINNFVKILDTEFKK